MANTCIFCGAELSPFNRKTVYCCTTEQPACRTCHKELMSLPAEERGRRALATGQARDAEEIRAYLADREKRAREKAEAEAQDRQARISDKTCPHCGIPMIKMGQQQFQLGEYSIFWGDWSHLAAGSMTLDMLYCEQCRKVEFFLPEEINV